MMAVYLALFGHKQRETRCFGISSVNFQFFFINRLIKGGWLP